MVESGTEDFRVKGAWFFGESEVVMPCNEWPFLLLFPVDGDSKGEEILRWAGLILDESCVWCESSLKEMRSLEGEDSWVEEITIIS